MLQRALVHAGQPFPTGFQASPRPLDDPLGGRSEARSASDTACSAFPGQIEALGVDCVPCTTSPDVEDGCNFLLASQLALQLLVEAEDGSFTDVVDISCATAPRHKALWWVRIQTDQ